MYVHCLMHVDFETPAAFERFYESKGWKLKLVRLYRGDLLPSLNEVDSILVMGGPMNVYEEEKYPFLKREKLFLKQAISENKKVVGVCLGAQMIASVLGARVYHGKVMEIGFYKVKVTDFANSFFHFGETDLLCFQWHGDSFDLPDYANRLFYSEVFENQGFLFKNTLALQFHLEVTRQIVKNLIENCRSDIDRACLSAKELEKIENFDQYHILHEKLFDILEHFYSI